MVGAIRYQTGEEIKQGDRINYHGAPGVVELVVERGNDDVAFDWLLERFPGGGVMINTEPMGRVFLPRIEVDDHLMFVRRER